MTWIKKRPYSKINKDDDIITQIAKVRGVKDIESFLNPKKESLHDPYILDNINAVAERIVTAITKKEKIGISADVDVDGLTATASLYRYLHQFTKNLYVLHHQRGKGHGIENQLEMLDSDTDLLIILDSSTNSTSTCRDISNNGTEILIIDHHAFEIENPFATIVNPQLDSYPNKSISGVGLVYKVIQVLEDYLTGELNADDFLDLVACGMYADMMDVSVPENRYLIIEGMKGKNIKNLGLTAIIDDSRDSIDKINSQTIGFGIAPIINGVARMEKIELALELLLCDDYEECKSLVKQMKAINEERKSKEAELVEMYENQVNEDDKVIIVTGNLPSSSFNGLVAQRLASKYKRPAIVMRDNEGDMKGSFRTFGGFKMKKFLESTGMVRFALGHEYAGGTGINSYQLQDFKDKINELMADVKFEKDLYYDLEIDAKEITLDLIEDIEKFNHLSGNGFPVLKFKVKGLRVADRKVIGKKKDTIKIICDALDIIKFKEDSSYAEEIDVFDTISAIGQLNINEYFNWRMRKNIVTPQMILEDYRHGEE